ncbi:hypothetical protein [Corynebacterium rhinophilum]|uniref:hypothetical protein n=1 Tax=Corynebacterium rhinophilum TaxID=3050197 RepID=UPI00254DBBDC|nr:hypothetical protein [Corynebacterium sp. MSK156]MDK8787224.1 hypothetical protein [Corynebacterium sp. MSK156]
MNPTVVKMAFKTGSNMWKQLRDYRQEKSRETYTALEEAAQQMQKEDNNAFDEARKQAGAVTQAAHSRLERALEDFNNYREDAVERFDEAKKKATKAAKKQTKKDKKSSKFWTVAGIVALLAAATGAIYTWLRSNDKPSQTPPRVDDYRGNTQNTAPESTLVYTSTSEAKPENDSDLAEEGAVRDEELLGSIDEQLAKHREEEEAAAEEADTSRITDDHQSEGKHRLQSDEQ